MKKRKTSNSSDEPVIVSYQSTPKPTVKMSVTVGVMPTDSVSVSRTEAGLIIHVISRSGTPAATTVQMEFLESSKT